MSSLLFTWKKWIQLGLEEDAVAFDWTVKAVQSLTRSAPRNQMNLNQTQTAHLISKGQGVWVGNDGLRAVELLSAEMDSPIKILPAVKDGDPVTPGQKIASWSGDPETLLIFERTLINLTAYTSGIATQTAALLNEIDSVPLKNKPRLVPTRKTLPGYRDLALASVYAVGAKPHRYNLSGGVLLKENHIATAGGVLAAVNAAKKTAPHLLKVEVEVTNLTALKDAIHAKAEVIMLDNFSPKQIHEAIRLKPTEGVCFEVSGGIHLGNIRDYCIEGVDVISVGSLTHSVKALDLSLLFNG